MGRYLLKRLLIFIPTLLALTLLAFFLLQAAPGDPVQQMLGQSGGDGQGGSVSTTEYAAKRKQMGLHLPLFYVSMGTMAEPDTLYQIPLPRHREFLDRLIYTFGNWEQIQAFYITLANFERLVNQPETDSALAVTTLRLRLLGGSLFRWDVQGQTAYTEFLDTLQATAASIPAEHALNQGVESILAAWQLVQQEATAWKTWIPSLTWRGSQCQYHQWMTGVLSGDFGTSYIDQKPVAQKVWQALKVTLLLSFLSVLITYLVSIPLGIWSARHRGLWQDRVVTIKLFVLFSLPSFWMAILLANFLANPDYLNLFPASGLQSMSHSSEWSIFRRLGDWGWHLVLPLIVYTYSSFAFLSRQVRVAMLDTLGQDFIRTARAKGLPEKQVVWRHGLRNALLPLITMFSSVFPALVGGSVILETLFTIPGTGLLTFQSIQAQDYPVVIAVFTLVATLTLFGLLVADILYAIADPRITFSRR